MSGEGYILSLDVGTTGVKAFLYSLEGRLINQAQCRLYQNYPKPGWVNFDGEQLWTKTLKVLGDVVAMSHVPWQKVKALGIVNQRESVLMWDAGSGVLLGPAISWEDRRVEQRCLALKECENLVKNKTGLPVDAYFSAPKISWMLEHYPDARTVLANKRLKVGTVDTFIMWRLSKGKAHVTDVTNASRTLLFNIKEMKWDEDLLLTFDIPLSVLPEIKSSDDYFTAVDKRYFEHTIPITGVLGDQQSSLLGHYCIEKGMTKITLGTGGFLLTNAGSNCPNMTGSLLTTIGYQYQETCHYALEGSLFSVGKIFTWMQNNLNLFQDISDAVKQAAALENNGEVYFLPALSGFGAPYWQSEIKAALFGMTLNTQTKHIVRAGLESIAYQIHLVLNALEQDQGYRPSSILIDGGVSQNLWLMQFLSNLVGIPVHITQQKDITGFGGFLIALIGLEEQNLQLQQREVMRQKSFTPNSGTKEKLCYDIWRELLKNMIAKVGY